MTDNVTVSRARLAELIESTKLHIKFSNSVMCTACGQLGEAAPKHAHHCLVLALQEIAAQPPEQAGDAQRRNTTAGVIDPATGDIHGVYRRAATAEPVAWAMTVDFRRDPQDGTPRPRILQFSDLGDGEHQLYTTPPANDEAVRLLRGIGQLVDDLCPWCVTPDTASRFEHKAYGCPGKLVQAFLAAQEGKQ